MDREIEKVKREFEEKQLKKKQQNMGKEKGKEKGKVDKAEDEKKEEDDDVKQAEKEKNDKVSGERAPLQCLYIDGLQIESIKTSGTESKAADTPRIYALHKYVVSPSHFRCMHVVMLAS
jgi:hypothetical protein